MKPKAGLATKILKTEEKTLKNIELPEACEDFKKHKKTAKNRNTAKTVRS